LDGDGNAASVNRNLAGFFSGFDARFGEFARVGLAGGYTHASVSVGDRASSAGIDTAHLGAYAGTSLGAFNLRTGAAYAFHTIDTSRTILFPGFFDKATAHYDGGSGQIFGEIGYGMTFGRFAVEPFAGATWVRVKTDGFSEAGGLAALNGAASSDNAFYASLGVSSPPATSAERLCPDPARDHRVATRLQRHDADYSPRVPDHRLRIRRRRRADRARRSAGGWRLRPAHHLTGQARAQLFRRACSRVRDHAVKGSFTWDF